MDSYIKEKLLASAKAMRASASGGTGPDIVIIVNSTPQQAEFWQSHLTGEDNIHGSAAAVKASSVVLSVTESNWKGGAGNALGTLNGFLQAARKARKLGLINVSSGAEADELIDVFLAYSSEKSVFMYHTAGKGTRIAPLPAAECNSKPNIKLAKMIKDAGEMRSLTILEAVLMETSIYAPSRKNRLSVFWGDQVIINELDISCKGKHHIEIFGELLPLTKGIKDYGILIPLEGGECRQREKLSMEEVRSLLPEGEERVYKSIGSFTVSIEFLKALLDEPCHKEYLAKEEGSLNTDPDWWQPLTSKRQEYIKAMEEKKVSKIDASSRWDKMNDMWQGFSSSGAFKSSGLTHKLGFTDVGGNSLWWDYGQNLYYLENMQLVAAHSEEGALARAFFGIREDEWIDETSGVGRAEVKDSVVLSSRIEGGRLEKCLVINSCLKNVTATGAIIVDSTVLDLNAEDALCYNVADRTVRLDKGKVLVNVFHPDKGRIPMMTDVYRDGKSDWESGERIYDNAYTYPQIAELMKETSIDASEKVKQEEIEKLKQ